LLSVQLKTDLGEPDYVHDWTVLSDRYPPDGLHGVWKIVGWPDEWQDGMEVLSFDDKAVA
jgi:hypothetical protein